MSMVAERGIVLEVDRFSTHDGPGIRTAVFMKGCPLACRWCHSPESQAAGPELIHRRARCLGCGRCTLACPRGALSPEEGFVRIDRAQCDLCRRCVEACDAGAMRVVGEERSVAELMEAVRQDAAFYRHSGGGVTVSGGEPLRQAAFVEALLGACRAEGIHTAIETCGYGDARALLRLGEVCDLIFFDVKLLDSEAHRAYTGQGNELILHNLATLCEKFAGKVVVRTPRIPGVNDAPEHLAAIARHAEGLGVQHTEVLPYNEAASAKYEWVQRPYPLDN